MDLPLSRSLRRWRNSDNSEGLGTQSGSRWFDGHRPNGHSGGYVPTTAQFDLQYKDIPMGIRRSTECKERLMAAVRLVAGGGLCLSPSR